MDLVFLVSLLHAGGLEVFQDHPGKVAFLAMVGLCFRAAVEQFIVLAHGQHTVRREAFHGERTGDADLLPVLIRLVVKVLVIGPGGDGCVDFLLAGDALLPPVRMELLCFLRPFGLGVAGDFPFFPGFAQCRVEALKERFQGFLELLPDHVNFGIIGNLSQLDVW